MRLEIFNNNEFGAVRVLADERGEPWFVAKDVCDVLGYANSRDALAKHIDEDDKRVSQIATPSGMQKMTLINESGLYSLILRSNKPQAKKFKKWVTSEVLPAIRKFGMYMTKNVIETIHKNPREFLKLVESYVEAVEKINLLTHTKKTYTTTEIAKELGFKSAVELNKKLQEKGIQYNLNGTWVLTSKYADKGYTETKQSLKANGIVVYYTRWTQKGREFLLELFSKQDFIKSGTALQENHLKDTNEKIS